MEDLLKITIGECECTDSFAMKVVYYSILALGATLIYFLMTNSVTQAYVFGQLKYKTLIECIAFFALILLFDLLIQTWRNSVCFVETS